MSLNPAAIHLHRFTKSGPGRGAVTTTPVTYRGFPIGKVYSIPSAAGTARAFHFVPTEGLSGYGPTKKAAVIAAAGRDDRWVL